MLPEWAAKAAATSAGLIDEADCTKFGCKALHAFQIRLGAKNHGKIGRGSGAVDRDQQADIAMAAKCRQLSARPPI